MLSSLLGLLWIAFPIVSFFLFPFIISYFLLLSYTFRPTQLVIVENGEMPDELRELMQPWIERAIVYDFRAVADVSIDDGFIRKERARGWGVICEHSSGKVRMLLMVSATPSNRYPVTCVLSGYYQGTNLVAVNTPNFSSDKPLDVERGIYIDGANFDELWAAYHDFIAPVCTEDLESMTVEESIDRYHRLSREIIQLRIKKGEFIWANREREIHRRHPLSALKTLLHLRNINRKAIPLSLSASDIDSIDSEVKAFLYNRDRSQKPSLTANQKLWLLIGSIILSILAFAAQSQAIQVAIFIGVIFLHELGHVMAMKLFGYRDTNMLFVPFLGAFATGRKENASLTERVWISLAGPIPGLLLGVCLAAIFPNTDNQYLKEAISILVFLNLFNLLPIYPLDGGHVVDLLFFYRYPKLAVIFQSIGVLLLGLLGFSSPVMFVFAAFIARTIPQNFQISQLRSQLRSKIRATDDPETIVRIVLETLATDVNYQNLSYNAKAKIVNSLLDSRQIDRSKFATKLGLSAIYLISLLGGFIGSVYSIIPNFKMLAQMSQSIINPQSLIRQRSEQLIAEADRKLQQNPRDIEAYYQRGNAYLLMKEYSVALNDANRAIELEPNNYQGYQLRASVRRQLGDISAAQIDEKSSRNLLYKTLLSEKDRLIQTDPQNIDAYTERSYIKSILGDASGAMADCNFALKLDAKSSNALLCRARLFVEAKNYRAARKDLDRALQLEPKTSELYELSAETWEGLGNKQQAEIDFRRAESIEYEEIDGEFDSLP